MLATYLHTRIAEQPDPPTAAAHKRIVDCHTGYHECPDETQQPRQVFEDECPTLLALTVIYGQPQTSPA